MKLNEYQKTSERTMPLDKPFVDQMVNYAMGLSGEAGEVTDLCKKVLYHGHPLTDEVREKIALELGDVLFYTAAMAKLIGVDLDDVAEKNIEKLRKRYPISFSSEASIHREE